MNRRGLLGRRGEQMAADMLVALGYGLLDRNWRCGTMGEIDLVCRCGEELVFVEVRLRRGQGFGSPEESITSAKKRRLIALAGAYVQTHDWSGDWRIDVVAIELDAFGRLIRQTHFRNAVTGWDD